MNKFILGVVSMVVAAIMMVLWYQVTAVLNGYITDTMAILILTFVGWLIAIAILGSGVGLIVVAFKSIAGGGKHGDIY